VAAVLASAGCAVADRSVDATPQDAEANWEQKKLTVTVKPGSDLDDEDVFEAIRQANFTPGECLQ